MIFRRSCIGCLLSASVLTAGFAQEGRVIIAGSADKELMRTAHRMHMPVEQLKHARELLQQATALARSLDPLPTQRLNNLAQLWLQMNRPKASATIDSLLEDVRRAAGKASDVASYRQISMAFQGLLQPLAELDPDRAAQEVRQWPMPPQVLGDEAARLRDQLMDQYLRQLVQRLMYQDPEKAASLYSKLGASSTADYYTPGQLALQLARAGWKDQAYKLVDQIIAGYRSQDPNPNALQNFMGFVQQLPNLDPDRFMQAFSLTVEQAGSLWQGIPGGTLKVGDNSLQLNGFDLRMLDILRSLSGRPELLQKALDALPGFKAKFEGVGGVDNALNPSVSAGGYSSIIYSSGGRSTISQSRSMFPPGDKISILFKELKGKAAKNPEMTRQRLSQVVKEPDDVDTLLSLAQRSSYEDPDLASLAIEVATPLVFQVQPLQRRAMLLQNLAQTSRQCNGDVDVDLLRDGFILADQLREEEKDKNPDTASRRDGNSPADLLEQTLLGQVAIDHYQAAMKYLNAMPDDEAKLAAQLRVVEALRQTY